MTKEEILKLFEKDDGIVKRIINHLYLEHKKELAQQKLDVYEKVLEMIEEARIKSIEEDGTVSTGWYWPKLEEIIKSIKQLKDKL